MRRQLSFIVSENDDLDGALTAYAREWLIIAASEIPNEKRSVMSLTEAVGINRYRIAIWLDALRIRKQINDKELLDGSEDAPPSTVRKVRFTVSKGDDLDGALTAYAREWLLLVASEMPSDECTLERLARKVGTNRQRVARWLDALGMRDEVDAMRKQAA